MLSNHSSPFTLISVSPISFNPSINSKMSSSVVSFSTIILNLLNPYCEGVTKLLQKNQLEHKMKLFFHFPLKN